MRRARFCFPGRGGPSGRTARGGRSSRSNSERRQPPPPSPQVGPFRHKEQGDDERDGRRSRREPPHAPLPRQPAGGRAARRGRRAAGGRPHPKRSPRGADPEISVRSEGGGAPTRWGEGRLESCRAFVFVFVRGSRSLETGEKCDGGFLCRKRGKRPRKACLLWSAIDGNYRVRDYSKNLRYYLTSLVYQPKHVYLVQNFTYSENRNPKNDGPLRGHCSPREPVPPSTRDTLNAIRTRSGRDPRTASAIPFFRFSDQTFSTIKSGEGPEKSLRRRLPGRARLWRFSSPRAVRPRHFSNCKRHCRSVEGQFNTYNGRP